MQYGTFATVPATAALAVARRRPRLALAIAGGGTAAWLLVALTTVRARSPVRSG